MKKGETYIRNPKTKGIILMITTVLIIIFLCSFFYNYGFNTGFDNRKDLSDFGAVVFSYPLENDELIFFLCKNFGVRDTVYTDEYGWVAEYSSEFDKIALWKNWDGHGSGSKFLSNATIVFSVNSSELSIVYEIER